MKNTARVYSGGLAITSSGGSGSGGSGNNERRPGSVKKQKQQRKAHESLVAKQNELSQLVSKLEDRDTQQQAFMALLEMVPQLTDDSLVRDLFSLIEKNKNPGRSSTRRTFVLVLAVLCKCHPLPSARLLPRLLAYISLRLRDKQVQITDACALLCSAITLYVVPFACVNPQTGNLSPPKQQQDADSTSLMTWTVTYETLVAHLSKETNAVGDHATKCIASVFNPTEMDGVSGPPLDVLARHGKWILPFLKGFTASIVAKMNESRLFMCFSSNFVLLQAVFALAKTLHQNGEGDVSSPMKDMLSHHVASLVDAIEDVFRDAPRDDWLLRKRAIELLIQVLDLFAVGPRIAHKMAILDQYFVANLERIHRLVVEARHDPVSAVRDAALPAVFQMDKLLTRFPRTGEPPPPSSPFKRVYHSSSTGGSIAPRPFRTGAFTPSAGEKAQDQDQDKEEKPVEPRDDPFDDPPSGEDEATAPTEMDEQAQDPPPPKKLAIAAVPLLKIDSQRPARSLEAAPPTVVSPPPPLDTNKMKRTKNNKRYGIDREIPPRLVLPKQQAQPEKKDKWVFSPAEETSDVFAEENAGDQQDPHFTDTDDQGDEAMPSSCPPPFTEAAAAAVDHHEPPQFTKAAAARQQTPALPSQRQEQEPMTNDDDKNKMLAAPVMTRRDAAIVAAAEGEMDLALRLVFLEDDATLLKKVLAMTRDPCMQDLSRASRTALCAAFLEMMDDEEEEGGGGGSGWLVLSWLDDLSRHRPFVQQLDPRVLRALEIRLNRLAETPTKIGQVAADILTKMGL